MVVGVVVVVVIVIGWTDASQSILAALLDGANTPSMPGMFGDGDSRGTRTGLGWWQGLGQVPSRWLVEGSKTA
ncbi:hypothetical protein LZ31DRAFT_599120 [Colletotrichum somersetense]|nr:hypothetical protein LZ31DRAFT_599120 [Colletotrichum somersetense]